MKIDTAQLRSIIEEKMAPARASRGPRAWLSTAREEIEAEVSAHRRDIEARLDAIRARREQHMAVPPELPGHGVHFPGVGRELRRRLGSVVTDALDAAAAEAGDRLSPDLGQPELASAAADVVEAALRDPRVAAAAADVVLHAAASRRA